MSDYFDRIERQLVARVEAGAAHRRLRLPLVRRAPGPRLSGRFRNYAAVGGVWTRLAGRRRTRRTTSTTWFAAPRQPRPATHQPSTYLRNRPLRREWLAPALGVLVVIVVAAAFLGLRSAGGRRATALAPPPPSGTAVTLAVPGSPATVRTTARILSVRLNAAFPHRHHTVSVHGASVILTIAHRGPAARAELVALTARGQVEFYDWEADALTPNGKTVASQLLTPASAATEISQGKDGDAGGPDTGSADLYDAIKLAEAVKHSPVGPFNSRTTALYYRFAASGSAACRAAARTNIVPLADPHCYVAGPATSIRALDAALPPGVPPSKTKLLTIPRGVTVLQAVPGNLGAVLYQSPAAQFYTLLDRVATTGRQLTNVAPGTDSGGEPDVTFRFTASGAVAFQQLTEAVARRGAIDSPTGQREFQHFAIAVDGQLVTVPDIDYHEYPYGLTNAVQAEIDGNFTRASARTLVLLIRSPLPISVRVLNP
jgi:hypothetical protein